MPTITARTLWIDSNIRALLLSIVVRSPPLDNSPTAGAGLSGNLGSPVRKSLKTGRRHDGRSRLDALLRFRKSNAGCAQRVEDYADIYGLLVEGARDRLQNPPRRQQHSR